MKNTINIYRSILLTLLIAICFTFASCSAETPFVSKEKRIENDSYSIEWKDGVGYLDFKNGNEKDDLYLDGCIIYSQQAEFKSVSDMRDALLNGTLSEDQLFTIRNFFPRSEDGSIIVIDPENITVPTLPSDMKLGMVDLHGTMCSFYVSPNSDKSSLSFRGMFYFVSKEMHDTSVKDFHNYDSILESCGYEIRSVTQTDERNATVYEYTTPAGTFKAIRYQITDNTKTIYVDECYRIAYPDEYNVSLPTSDTVPISISLYGSDGNTYFMLSCYSLQARPSVEWISAWGVMEYTPAE